MNIKSVFPVVIGALVLAAIAAPANAGTKDDIRALDERLNRLEQSVTAGTAATLRISDLEREIQALTGRIENLQFELGQSNARLDAVSATLSGETPAGGLAYGPAGGPVDLVPGGSPSSGISSAVPGGDPIAEQIAKDAAASAPAGIELPLDPNAAFDYASAFLLQGDYQRAKGAFQLYVKAFPNHARSPDAQFRLGEIHLALGENADAADVFIAHIRNYPNDPRAAEAYLKLGTAFARLKRPTEACTVFKTMKTKFPGAGQAVVQRANLEMVRIDCQ